MKSSKTPENGTILQKEFRHVLPGLLFTFVLGLAAAFCSLRIPFYTGRIVDDIFLGKGWDFWNSELLLSFLLLGAAILLNGIFQYAVDRMSGRLSATVTEHLENRVFSKIQRLPMAFLDRHPTGDILNRMTTDIRLYTTGMFLGFSQLVTGIGLMVGTMVALFLLNVWIALAVLLLTPLSLLIARFISKRISRFFQKNAEERSRVTSYLAETVPNEKNIQVYHMEEACEEELEKRNRALHDASKKSVFFSSLINPTSRFVNSLVYAVVLLIGSLYAISGSRVVDGVTVSGMLSVGTLVAALSYVQKFAKPFNDISAVIAEIESAKVSGRRIEEFLAEEEIIDCEPDAASVNSEENRSETESRSEKAVPEISFSHVDFSYTGERKILQDVSFSIRRGEHIAIVGKTGSGKTTILNLLLKYYENYTGDIRLSGVSIRDISNETLRKKVGLVLQTTWLFPGTIYENLVMGKDSCTREEVIAAARLTGLDRFVRRLKDGYETLCDNENERISAGEKQLIAVTRLLIARPDILIFDEATSSLDVLKELEIAKAIDEVTKNRTTITVAHRLSTVRHADRVFIVEEGALIEIERHDVLDSTSNEAARRVQNGLTKPLVITANEQTAGRGRQGHTFYSPKDTGIYLTLAYPVAKDSPDLLRITAKAAVAVYRGILSRLTLPLSIKWVNDIYCGSKKAAGILAENLPGDFVLIGIGINQTTENFPEKLRDTAGSLGAFRVGKEELLVPIVEALLWELNHLEDTSYLETYREHSMVLGKMISFERNGIPEEGLAMDIDDSGALVVEKADGEKVVLTSGSITMQDK